MLEIRHSFWILVAVHVVVMFLGPWWTARQLAVKKGVGFGIGCLVGGCFLHILTLMAAEHTLSAGDGANVLFVYFVAVDLVMAAVGAVILLGYGTGALARKYARVGEKPPVEDEEKPGPS